MDDMIPFLRAVAAHPDDDTPRLVFADWLDEHDHADRAEFIRLQVELARMGPGDDGYAEKTAAMRRCGVLVRKGEVPFFDHLPDAKCRVGFRRGFIEAVDTGHGATLADTSGFDLVPLQSLRTDDTHVEKFKGFTRLKWLEYHGGEVAPARMLEVLGPGGWFSHLETLCLPGFNAACLAAGVIPRFELPRLRNLFLNPPAFSDLGTYSAEVDEDDDEYYRRRRWSGLPDYLPANAVPNERTPLERFVWHSDDDSDSYGDDGWYWRGPTMESLLARLRHFRLRQVEMAVDHDDHENGGEGVITAAYRRNPLELAPTLEHVTLNDENLDLPAGSDRRLRGLRVYGEGDFTDRLFALLGRPVCSELASLHAENRDAWGTGGAGAPSLTFPRLTSLHLAWMSLAHFSNCRFPGLISLTCGELQPVLAMKWPRLQRLDISADLPELKSLAGSDCCPNLTTLTIDGYFPSDTDFSFLASCPHMPHLSLISVDGFPRNRDFIVNGGRLLPVRGDVMAEDMTPTTEYRLHAVF